MFHYYGLIVGVAAVVWWSIAEYLEPRLKKIIPTTLLLSLVGARAYHVFEYFSHYQANIIETLAVWNGGLSIWGALIGGFAALKISNLKSQISKKEESNLYQAVVTPLPLAQAIGRVANGVNGEFNNLVFGIPWWGMEAILDLVLFGILWFCPRQWRVGIYLVGYCLIRLALKPYRE